jgi:phospholipid-binding lipoprotein MlaA
MIVLLTVSAMLSGCYLSPPNTDNPHDPFEHINRDANRMNVKLDSTIIKPIAKEYRAFTPYFVRRGISNFFSNLAEPENVANDLLQGHFRWALNDAWSFVINSTVGIGGFWNAAKHIDLQPHDNDFGLTLNQWGLYSAYFVLPFIGPNTLGSVIGMPIDYYTGVTKYFIPLRYSAILTILNGINLRAQLLSTEKTANGLILDKYLFYRSAYLQHRVYLYQLNQQGPVYPVVQPAQEPIGNDDQLLPEQPIN